MSISCSHCRPAWRPTPTPIRQLRRLPAGRGHRTIGERLAAVIGDLRNCATASIACGGPTIRSGTTSIGIASCGCSIGRSGREEKRGGRRTTPAGDQPGHRPARVAGSSARPSGRVSAALNPRVFRSVPLIGLAARPG
jgi:hypothetical protein